MLCHGRCPASDERQRKERENRDKGLSFTFHGGKEQSSVGNLRNTFFGKCMLSLGSICTLLSNTLPVGSDDPRASGLRA